jgi:ATPase subunit of ABC transporter with duplicated ATPase domains
MTVTFDSVCTHISDIDFSKINHYSGIILSGMNLVNGSKATCTNKTKAGKRNKIEEFIRRFSECGKSKQATSRKKMISKLNISEIKPSSRRYQYI